MPNATKTRKAPVDVTTLRGDELTPRQVMRAQKELDRTIKRRDNAKIRLNGGTKTRTKDSARIVDGEPAFLQGDEYDVPSMKERIKSAKAVVSARELMEKTLKELVKALNLRIKKLRATVKRGNFTQADLDELASAQAQLKTIEDRLSA